MKNLLVGASNFLGIELNAEIEGDRSVFESLMEDRFLETNYIEAGKVLYDLDKQEVILENTSTESINELLKNKDLEIFKINDLYPEKHLPLDVNSVESLIIHGNFINTCADDPNHKLYKVTNKIKKELPIVFFIDDTKERLAHEAYFNKLYEEIINYKIDFISDEIIDFINEKNVKILEIGWIPLSQKDYEKIAKTNIDLFSIIYTFNQKINILPKSIKELSIRGNIIQTLGGIEFSNLKLETLIFSINSIKDSIYLGQFYSEIEFLCLDNNLITKVDFTNLSNVLESIDLSDNQITNDNFIIKEPCNHLSYLDLKNNKLTINLDFLYKIDRFFPNLEFIDLSGNIFTDHFGTITLSPMEGENQIEKIKNYLEQIEFNQNLYFEEIADGIERYDEKYTAKIRWNISNSSTALLIREIQFYLKDYFKLLEEDAKCFFAEGVYMNLYNKKISMLINSNEDFLSIEFFSSNNLLVQEYFCKYLDLLYSIIYDVTHQYILPSVELSDNLKDLSLFFKKVYKIDTKLKQKKTASYLIESKEKEVNSTLLVSEDPDYYDTRVAIDQIFFIIISSKSAIVYTLEEGNIISNYVLVKNKKRLNSLVVRTADDKEKYKKALLNPYINNKLFKEINAYIDNDVKKRFTIIINQKYISQKEEETGVLYVNDLSYLEDKSNLITEHSKVEIINGELLFRSK